MGKMLIVLTTVCLMSCGGNGNDGGQNPATVGELAGEYVISEVKLTDIENPVTIPAGPYLWGEMSISNDGELYVNFIINGTPISGRFRIERVENNEIVITDIYGEYRVPYTYDDDILILTFPGEDYGFEGTMIWEWIKISDEVQGAIRERPVTTDDVIGDIYRGIKGIYGKVYY